MKHFFVLTCLFIVSVSLQAAPSVAVIDFDSGNYCTAQNASVMTGLFRNELVRFGQAEVVDRRNTDKIIDEMKFQMSDWVSPSRMKKFGQMTGADYIICGNFDMLGSQLYLIVQMIDIETSRVIHSSRLSLASWDEYDWKVHSLAGEFIKKIPQENYFIGEWEASIENYNYNIVFLHSNMCIITIKTMQDGKEIVEDTNGTWSYDNNIIRVNGNFYRSAIKNLDSINWVSVYSFNNNDNSSFNIIVSPLPGKSQQRISFARIIQL